MGRGDDRTVRSIALCRAAMAGWLIAAPGCVALNSSYQDSGSDDGGAGGTGSAGTPTPSSTVGGGGTAGATTGESTDAGSVTTQTDEPPFAWEFTDDERSEFEAGELALIEWDDSSDAVILTPATNKGQLRSRVFQTDGIEAHLTHLEWTTRAPYGVGLWDAEVDGLDVYPMGGIDTSGLELLLRFDRGGAPFEPMDTVLDASSMGNHGTVHGPQMISVRGVFDWAAQNWGDSYLQHSTSALAPGTAEFTWTAWFRGDACEPSASIVNFDALDTADEGTASIWLACGQSEGCSDRPGLNHGVVHGAVLEIDEAGNDAGLHRCGTARIDDGEWHHLAMVVRRSQGMTHLDVFVDGEDEGSASLESQSDYAYNNLQVFSTVGNADLHHPAAGAFDEVMVWRRALSPEELRSLHARGARRISVRLRACAETDCSDDPPFTGPYGLDSFFIDSGPEHDHGHDVGEFDLVGVAFQYELTLEVSAPVASPQLPRISLYAER